MSVRRSTALAPRLLGRHVGGRPHDDPHSGIGGRPGRRIARIAGGRGFQRLAQPEVQHLDGPVALHLDVGGLQVAMDDAGLVRRFQSVRELRGDGEHLVGRHRSPGDARFQRRTLDQLQHQRPHAAVFLDAVDLRDVRVVERGQQLGLPLEPGQPIGIGGEDVPEQLEGDVAVQPRVAGAIHFAHPARAEDAGDLEVPREPVARGQRHAPPLRRRAAARSAGRWWLACMHSPVMDRMEGQVRATSAKLSRVVRKGTTGSLPADSSLVAPPCVPSRAERRRVHRQPARSGRLLEGVTQGQEARLVERPAEEGEADGETVAGEAGGHDEIGKAGEIRVPRRRAASPERRRLDELMSVLQRGSVGRWVFAEVERDLISERTPEDLGQVPRAEARGLKPSPYSVFPHESGRYPQLDE